MQIFNIALPIGVDVSNFSVEERNSTEQLKLIYSMYADTDNSLGDIVRYLNEHNIKNRRGANILSLLYEWLVHNRSCHILFCLQAKSFLLPINDFMGYNACYLYKGVSTTKKQYDLSDKEIVLAALPIGVDVSNFSVEERNST